MLASDIKFDELFDQASFNGINQKIAPLCITCVADRRKRWPLAAAQLRPVAAPDVFSEIVHVVFGVGKCYGQEEFARW